MTETKKPETITRRQAFGGVSPVPKKGAIKGVEKFLLPTGAPTAGAFPNFSYYGGPVITCPQVYTSFWGSLWLSDPAHLARAARLSQFHADLLQSGFMNVLSQYGVGFGAGIAGAFIRASIVTNVPSNLANGDIESIIQSCVDAGALPEPTKPSNIALIIYLDETIGVNDPPFGVVMCEPSNDDAFGYHYFFTTTAGHPFYYAVIPGLTDGCLTESCPSDAGCSLHIAQTQEQRQTQVASHEFAEMVTDPELNAWLDPSAGENGDICNGESDTITVGANTWAVQRTYSKTDDVNTNGASFCLAQAPAPIPKLSPGPSGVSDAAALRVARSGHLDRLLPLPPVYFDAQARVVSLNQHEVRRYATRLFHPLLPKHVMPDLPGFLRQVGDIIAKNK